MRAGPCTFRRVRVIPNFNDHIAFYSVQFNWREAFKSTSLCTRWLLLFCVVFDALVLGQSCADTKDHTANACKLDVVGVSDRGSTAGNVGNR